MLERHKIFHSKPKNIEELKNVLQVIWDQLPQVSINKAIVSFTRRIRVCLKAEGGHFVIVIVIVNSKLLKRHSKAKRRAPAYSRALRQIRGVFQRIVRGKLRSGCQKVRGGRLGVKAGVV